MNKAILVGRLTKDIELKKTQSNQSVCNFTIAINRTFTNANGEREADFINCVAWGRTADNMATYVSKGSLIGVDGRIQTRSYEDPQSATCKRIYVTEVVADNVQFLESKGNSQANVQPNVQPANQQSNDFFADFNQNDESSPNNSDTFIIDDDELPF